jgi:hypothetical protein
MYDRIPSSSDMKDITAYGTKEKKVADSIHNQGTTRSL